MVEYAQTDAHFLLYIADSLIAELKQQVVGMPSIVFTFMIDTFIIYLLISYNDISHENCICTTKL